MAQAMLRSLATPITRPICRRTMPITRIGVAEGGLGGIRLVPALSKGYRLPACSTGPILGNKFIFHDLPALVVQRFRSDVRTRLARRWYRPRSVLFGRTPSLRKGANTGPPSRYPEKSIDGTGVVVRRRRGRSNRKCIGLQSPGSGSTWHAFRFFHRLVADEHVRHQQDHWR